MAELRLGQEVVSTTRSYYGKMTVISGHHTRKVIMGGIWLIYKLTEKKNQVTIHLKCTFNRILCSIQISDLKRNMMLAALMEAIIDNVGIWLG